MAGDIDWRREFHKLLVTVINLVSALVDKSIALGSLQIRRHHLSDELTKCYLWLPPQFCLRLAGIPDKGIYFRGPEIARVYGDYAFAPGIECLLREALAAPCQADTHFLCNRVYKFSHRVLPARRDHKILWSV